MVHRAVDDSYRAPQLTNNLFSKRVMTQAIIASEILTDDPFIRSVQDAVLTSGKSCSSGLCIPVGGRTKTGLLPTTANRPIEISQYSGIVTYDASEYLITAKAGTRITELQQALAKNGQFLPFDPLWVDGGATLGGTIASGVSGPDRLLYGGVRDFVMEVAMVDGLGRIVRGGGKVVKNAAGFDTPKMMVGSYGRLGVLVEATLKVFPAPQAYATLVVPHSSVRLAINAMQRVLSKPLPISSVTIDSQHQLCLRVAGPRDSLSGVIERIRTLLPEKSSVAVESDAEHLRQALVSWLEQPTVEGQVLIRIGVSPRDIIGLQQVLANCEHYHLGACSVTWAKLAVSQLAEIDQGLSRLGLSAVVVGGRSEKTFLGNLNWLGMAQRIQQAIDPNGRFVPWY